MRILFLSHYFPPEGMRRPRARSPIASDGLPRAHDVTVLTCVPNHPKGVVYAGYRNHLRRVEDVEGIRVVRVFTYLAANAGTWGRIANYLLYMLGAVFFGFFERRPDMVIATSPQFFCGWAGVLLATFRRLPFLLEIRDLWPESISAVEAMQSRIMLRLIEKLERWMYRAAWHIVTVGEAYRNRLIASGIDQSRVSVIMNGVDRERFFPREKNRALAERFGVADRFVVTYCGTIGLAHGLDVVLRAGALLRERGRLQIVFLLVGDGARLDDLRDGAKQRGLDNVRFTGNIDKNLIPDVLALSDVCLVHLRESETFTVVMPSKIFEAAAMARPIILGIRGFAEAFVRKAGCGLCIEPENEEELVEAVLRLEDARTCGWNWARPAAPTWSTSSTEIDWPPGISRLSTGSFTKGEHERDERSYPHSERRRGAAQLHEDCALDVRVSSKRGHRAVADSHGSAL